MKRALHLLFLSAIITVALTSCNKAALITPKKVHITAAEITPGEINGTWQFVAERGGLTGGYIPIPNIYTTYTFNADSTYSHVPDNKAGTYHIGLVKSLFTGELANYISLTSVDYSGLLDIRGDTLTISDNHTEPYIAIYKRVK